MKRIAVLSLFFFVLLAAAVLSSCGGGDGDSTTQPTPHNHVEVIDPAVSATCKAEGKTEGKHCSECGEIFVAQVSIPKTAHSFGSGVNCTVCGEHRPSEFLSFSYVDGGCVVKKGMCMDENIYIPSVHDGAPVIGIVANAFQDSNITSITIPDSVTSIDSHAFARCSNLISIQFQGTQEQWKEILKQSDWNNSTGKYTIHCNDGDIQK